MPRPKRTHVQPNGCRSWSSIECKREWPFGEFLAIKRISYEEHLSFNLPVTAFDGQASSGRGVFQKFSGKRDLVVRDDRSDLGHVIALFLLVVSWLGLGLRRSRFGALRGWLLGPLLLVFLFGRLSLLWLLLLLSLVLLLRALLVFAWRLSGSAKGKRSRNDEG